MTGSLPDPLDEELALSDLLNHVLDKGVVISGDVTISVANIDLVRVGLSVLLTGVATEERTLGETRGDIESNADVRVLSADREP